MDAALILKNREKSRPNQLARTQIILSGVLLGLSFADLVITRFLVKNSFAQEGNPLIRGHINADGFGILKITGTLFAVLIIADIFRRHPKFTVNAMSIIVSFYTIIVWWNVYLAPTGIFR
jgi:hypothetical protein